VGAVVEVAATAGRPWPRCHRAPPHAPPVWAARGAVWGKAARASPRALAGRGAPPVREAPPPQQRTDVDRLPNRARHGSWPRPVPRQASEPTLERGPRMSPPAVETERRVKRPGRLAPRGAATRTQPRRARRARRPTTTEGARARRGRRRRPGPPARSGTAESVSDGRAGGRAFGRCLLRAAGHASGCRLLPAVGPELPPWPRQQSQHRPWLRPRSRGSPREPGCRHTTWSQPPRAASGARARASPRTAGPPPGPWPGVPDGAPSTG
jgi:hypothetical protein